MRIKLRANRLTCLKCVGGLLLAALLCMISLEKLNLVFLLSDLHNLHRYLTPEELQRVLR